MESPKPNNDEIAIKRFKIIMIFARISGIPILMKNTSYLYKLYQYFFSPLWYYHVLGSCIDSFTKLDDDVELLFKSLSMTVPYLFVFCCDFPYRLRRAQFESLIQMTGIFTWEDMPERDPDTGDRTMAGWISVTQKFVKYNIFMVGSIAYVLQCIYNGITRREYVFESWYPYDKNSSLAFALTFPAQVIFTSLSNLPMFSFLCLCVLAIEIACVQLDKLKIALLDIKRNHDSSYEEMQKQLNECVRHHQLILEYMNKLEEVLSISFMALFFTIMLTMCFAAFAATILWKQTFMMARIVLESAIVVFYLFIFCGFGQLLSDKAAEVADAAYSVEWVGAPISFQRSIRIIITVANKPFFLTAGKFVPVSRPTLMNILNETVSLFMFLLQVQE